MDTHTSLVRRPFLKFLLRCSCIRRVYHLNPSLVNRFFCSHCSAAISGAINPTELFFWCRVRIKQSLVSWFHLPHIGHLILFTDFLQSPFLVSIAISIPDFFRSFGASTFVRSCPVRAISIRWVRYLTIFKRFHCWREICEYIIRKLPSPLLPSPPIRHDTHRCNLWAEPWT